MKTQASIFLALVLFPVLAHSQSYAIDWFTIDSGGGTSTGGVYSVSGTIGQPDAGRSTGGSYALEAGFWGFVGTIQTPGAPLLSAERVGAGPAVRVFWSASATGYLLDETALLTSLPVSWSQVTSGLQTNGTQVSLTVPLPVGTKYYRLRKP
jgi:hypothetical protein